MDYLDINLNFEERYLWKENKKLFELLRLDNNYTNVIFDERSGGVSATHILHSKSNCKEEIVLNGKTGKQLEEECQKVIRQKGGSCILESEKLQQNGLFLVSLDATIMVKEWILLQLPNQVQVWYLILLLEKKNKQ